MSDWYDNLLFQSLYLLYKLILLNLNIEVGLTLNSIIYLNFFFF